MASPELAERYAARIAGAYTPDQLRNFFDLSYALVLAAQAANLAALRAMDSKPVHGDINEIVGSVEFMRQRLADVKARLVELGGALKNEAVGA